MICLNSTDTLEGGASVDAVVDYTVYGLVNSIPTRLTAGQLSSTNPSILYAVTVATYIVSIIYVNTHSSAVTVDLYVDPANAGTPRRQIPKELTLQPGYSMHWDGARFSVINISGELVTSGEYPGAGIPVSSGTGWESSLVAAAESSFILSGANPSFAWVVKTLAQVKAIIGFAFATAAEIIAGTETAKIIAPDQLKAANIKSIGDGSINVSSGKTITATQDTSLDEAVAMSSKAPKAYPTFTGDVKGSTADGVFASINPTNTGVGYVGHDQSKSIADNQSFTVTFGNYNLMTITDQSDGKAAIFFMEYVSATIVKLADPSSFFEVTNTDTNKICVYKGANSGTCTIKNYSNATININVNCLGQIQSATNPA